MAERTNKIIHGDNLPVLRAMPGGSVDLVYIDPPFNTGRTQRRRSLRTTLETDGNGDRTGFNGLRYRTEVLGVRAYADRFDDYLLFLEPRLRQAHRVLKETGSLYLHLDYREAHRAKLLLDDVFGPENFQNELVWAYDYGARPNRRWPAKHDTILFYSKDPARYHFDNSEVERIPYMAPGLVGEEKRARGKLPTDVWWHTIVSPTGAEKTGYPTQKPVGVLKRIVSASCPPGGLVLDFFAGSGTTGAAALELGRRFILVDNNPDAIAVMRDRFCLANDLAARDDVEILQAAEVPEPTPPHSATEYQP